MTISVENLMVMTYQILNNLEYTLQIEVPVVDDYTCQESYGDDLIYDSMLCAGYENVPKDTCQVFI